MTTTFNTESDPRPVPCMLMRGGSSRRPLVLNSDLPQDRALRDSILLTVISSPDRHQIDGLEGAAPLSSKAGIVGLSSKPDVDLKFLFAQFQKGNKTVDTTPNCGSTLASVVPFALKRGIILAQDETATVRVITLNTGVQCDITVATPNGQMQYGGDASIDGVPGTSAAVTINFLVAAGSVCPALLPTARALDAIAVQANKLAPFTIDATLIDNGMPMAMVRDADLNHSGGDETVAELGAADTAFMQFLSSHLCHDFPRLKFVIPHSGGTRSQ